MRYGELGFLRQLDLDEHLMFFHSVPYELVATYAEQAIMVPFLMNNELGYAQGAQQTFQQGAGFQPGPAGVYLDDNYDMPEGTFQWLPIEWQLDLDEMNFNWVG